MLIVAPCESFCILQFVDNVMDFVDVIITVTVRIHSHWEHLKGSFAYYESLRKMDFKMILLVSFVLDNDM